MAQRSTTCRLLSAFCFWLVPVAILFLTTVESTRAQTCGGEYVMKEAESLADVAGRAYGNPSQWTIIFYANQDRMGANAFLLVPGISIRIPCLAGTVAVERSPGAGTGSGSSAPAPVLPSAVQTEGAIELSSVVKRIEFLTADGYTPFTDRSLPNGGMVTNIVSAAMELIKDQSKGGFAFNVSWVNDWAAHLNPLLITRAFDTGFPWLKPDCDKAAELTADARYRCQKFFFSEPLYEVLTVLFVKNNSPLTFAKDDQMLGKTLCQPAGYSTYELDKGGRNWVRDNKITLLRPPVIEECFRLLDVGSVNAVVTADLTGKSVIAALNMSDRIKALPRPLAIGTLHLIVAKAHPNASTLLYYINTAMAKLKESGQYDKIVESHLSSFWNAQEKK